MKILILLLICITSSIGENKLDITVTTNMSEEMEDKIISELYDLLSKGYDFFNVSHSLTQKLNEEYGREWISIGTGGFLPDTI